VVELAAQRMLGWQPDGEPFRKLLNQNADIPSQASRVHGYTREILERDGESAHQVYREFSEYVAGRPLVAFNLEYDLDEVLRPEWKRLGISAIGGRGFCALRLAQRLLDPVPAGNCKLQTLRQYYRLPERGAHTALGDVQTVADLLEHVLRPVARHHGLDTWEKLVEFAAEEWFPSRIAFGKHKGRLIQEARNDTDLQDWLDWLAKSSNLRSAKMGRWYLRQLKMPAVPANTTVFAGPEIEREGQNGAGAQAGCIGLVIYINPELEQLRQLVAGARARLVELEVNFTKEKTGVDVMQAVLFRQLREHYQKRDRLRLIVDYRQKFLDSFLRGGEDDAKQAETDYRQAKTHTDKEYEETAAAVAEKKQLTAEEEVELSRLWKKLVKLYHPDRFANQPDKLETYHKLTAAINRAKDSGDIKALKDIAEDPHGYILRQGWVALDFSEEVELAQLRRLNETLQLEIIAVIEALNRLKESPDYELCQLSHIKPAVLDDLAAERVRLLNQEISELEKRAGALAEEIKELSGMAPESIG
jgi:DNA polymerase-3 subunit epsilon